jgi:hypothetical protein
MIANQFKPLSDDESVISVKEDVQILMDSKMCKINDLKKSIIKEAISVPIEIIEGTKKDAYLSKRLKWINEGLKCEILKLGSNNWKKGKVRINISLEFCPDEPEISEYESPLDEIRNHPSFPNS